MNRRILTLLALAVSMLYGVGFTVLGDTRGYAPIGGVVVALAWIAVSVFGLGDVTADRAERRARRASRV